MATTNQTPASLVLDGALTASVDGVVPSLLQVAAVSMITLYQFTIITIAIIFVIM